MTPEKKIEELLREYPTLKSKINIRLITYSTFYSLKAVNYNKDKIGKTNKIYSEVEDFVIRAIGEDSIIWKMIKKRDIITAALECLTEEEYKIVELLYFENKTQIEAGFELKLSESTIRKRKKEILDKLEDVGILKAWEIKY